MLADKTRVVYELALSRGKAVLEKLFPVDPGGLIAVVDGWPAYAGFFARIQRCWAHLIRESWPSRFSWL